MEGRLSGGVKRHVLRFLDESDLSPVARHRLDPDCLDLERFEGEPHPALGRAEVDLSIDISIVICHDI